MCFFNEDDDLLEKYSTIWDKVNANKEEEFDSEPVYNKNFLKTKIKSFGDEVIDFYNKEIAKVDSNYTCFAVINLDSALKKGKNYYPQGFSKECKYIQKKVIRHINDNLSGFFSSDYPDDFDEESMKAMRLVSFKKATLKMYLLREQFF